MPSLVVGTAGHIDHGKSALVEALTGTDPDRLKEEKSRGITIELGFAHAVIDDVDVAFVDVPGHERFVRTMLAGAGGIDAVLLIIAADESIMPQTREHFEICRLLGISHGVIVLTKSDLADHDTLEIAALEARELVAASALADAPVIAVSVRTGAGLDDLRAALLGLARRRAGRAGSGVARVPIDRVFTVKGFGSVVTGTLVSGTIAEGDVLAILPGGQSARVRGLQVHGRTERVTSAPRRVAVNLGGVDLSALGRGMTLAPAGSLAVTRRVDVFIEMLKGVRALRHGARVRLHQGTSEAFGRVAVAAVRSQRGAAWESVGVGQRDVAVAPGGEAFVRLRLERHVVMTRGDRFVLRASSPVATIGGGIVLDPEPPASGVRRPATFARFQQLHGETDDAARLWLREAGLAGCTAADLARRGGVSPEEADAALGRLIRAGEATVVAGVVIPAARERELARALIDAVTAFHRQHPLEDGAAREALRDRLAAGASANVFDAVVAALARSGEIAGTDRLALASHQPTPTGDDARVRQTLEEALRAAAYQPPDLATLSAGVTASVDIVARILHGLVRDRVVTKVDTLWFHEATLARLKEDVQALGRGARLDVSTVKTRYGISRKFAIPLLEYLDRERVTRRVGEGRIVI